ncbi:hypothetical protein AB4874_17215 [Thioclava sp. 15-R06ZXC-3]|uniref:Uncharacterized protein n=1 Tax=Thioclava arctica TaxID=3238301 RepID=A0ABV3TP56_9RHOB
MAKWLDFNIEGLTKVLNFLGDVTAALAVPIDILGWIAFLLFPIDISEEMQFPALVGMLAATMVYLSIIRLVGPAFVPGKVRIFSPIRDSLIYPIKPEFRDEVADFISSKMSDSSARIFILGPFADYLRGLRQKIPEKYLLARFDRAAEDIERIFESQALGPGGSGRGSPLRQVGVVRTKAAVAVFIIILVDHVWYESLSSGMLLIWDVIRVVAITLTVVFVFLILLFVLVALKNRFTRSPGRSGKAGSGWVARYIWRGFNRMMEIGRDPSLLDPGEFKLGLPEYPDTELARSPVLSITHINDVSYSSVAGVRLLSWPARIQVVSHGGMSVTRRAKFRRGIRRRVRQVVFQFRPEDVVLDTIRVPVLGLAPPPVAPIKTAPSAPNT